MPWGQRTKMQNRSNIVTNSIKTLTMVHIKKKMLKKIASGWLPLFRVLLFPLFWEMRVSWTLDVQGWLSNKKRPLKSWCGWRLHDGQALSLTCQDMNTKGVFLHSGFPGSSHGKESAYHAGDLDSSPGLERPPGEGNGNPLQYSCLENLMDRGTWRSIVHVVAKSQTQLSN